MWHLSFNTPLRIIILIIWRRTSEFLFRCSGNIWNLFEVDFNKIKFCRLDKKGKEYYMKKPIKSYVKQLVKIVTQMQKNYPEKKFTLDGWLVGDIGEILAAEKYLIELNEGLTKHHDAMCTEGTRRKVQIKSTMKDFLTFPCDHVPQYLDDKEKVRKQTNY